MAGAPAFGDHLVVEVPRHGFRRLAPITPEWTPRLDGAEIDRDRFYEMVGRPDVAHARRMRRDLGALAMVGGIAMAALGVVLAHAGHAVAGVFAVAGGSIGGALGAQNLVNPDVTSADEARRMLGARF